MGKRITGPPPPGNVVKEFYIGNTYIQICDDACRGQTAEEAQAILDRIGKKLGPAYFAEMERRTKAAKAA